MGTVEGDWLMAQARWWEEALVHHSAGGIGASCLRGLSTQLEAVCRCHLRITVRITVLASPTFGALMSAITVKATPRKV